jgi:hypothetical protein
MKKSIFMSIIALSTGVLVLLELTRRNYISRSSVDPTLREQRETSRLLAKILADVFDSSVEKLALALGRPIDEIHDWTSGEPIDADARMKIHALGMQRGVVAP